MSVVLRRKLLESAQALAKTNAPMPEHYEDLLVAVARLFTAETGLECECTIVPAAPQSTAQTAQEE